MGRLGLHPRKKLLIEQTLCGLCVNRSLYGRTFAEEAQEWLGKWAWKIAGR